MGILHPDFNFFRPRFWFGQLDSRPLSLFRILFAAVLLKDALYHLFIARIFYSDAGIIPRETLLGGLARTNRFSLLDAFGHPVAVGAFFLLWCAVLIALMLGYRTRTMTVLNFILILSVHERNIYVLNGGDTVFRVLSFWAMFIPLGQYYSVDAVRRRWARFQTTGSPESLRVEDAPRTVFAFPVRMIQIQFALIYVFTFLMKLPGDDWRNGDALYYALQLRSLTLPTGDWFVSSAPYPLLEGLTYFTLFIEGAFVLLMFLPLFQPYLRGLGLFLGLGLHVGIGVLMAIGNFSNIMLAGYALFFLPGWVVWLDERLRRPRFPLCMPYPPQGHPLWLALSVTRSGEIALIEDAAHPEPHFDGWTVTDSAGMLYQGMDAWRVLAAHLPLSRFWSPALRFRPVRAGLWRLMSFWAGQVVYQKSPPQGVFSTSVSPQRLVDVAPPLNGDFMAEKSAPHRSDKILSIAARVAVTLVTGLLMAWVIRWNMGVSGWQQDKTILPELEGTPRETLQYLGLWQSWGMFSPRPSHLDGWIIIPGVFEDDTTYDLLTGQPVDTANMTRWFFGPEERWKKFQDNMYRDNYVGVLEAWGRYFCDLYNNVEGLPIGERLATLEIHAYVRISPPPGEDPEPYAPRILWRHWCYPEYQY